MVDEAGARAGGGSQISLTATAFAIYNHLRAGDEATARRLLVTITPVFDRVARTTYVYGGSLDRIVAAIWELGATRVCGTLPCADRGD